MFETIRSGKQHALLLAEAVEIVVGENPAISTRFLDDAAPQGIGVVVIGEAEHVQVSELDLGNVKFFAHFES